MNATKAYGRKTILFREGDPGDCMYDIEFGRVGIYHDYGGENEKLITVLDTGKVFGEMGLLDHAPRSATAVVMDDDTALTTVTEEDFMGYFAANPPKVLDIMQQMSNRLRRTTKDYIEACHTVYEEVETKKSGKKRSRSLLDRINELCSYYDMSSYYSYF